MPSQQQPVLPVTVRQQIAVLCARFQADSAAGRRPRIEDYLATAAGVERAPLLLALLQIDMELLAGQGRRPNAPDYLQRFPDQTDVVRAALREAAGRTVAQQPAASIDTSAGGDSVRSGPAAVGPAFAQVPTQIGRFQVLQVLGTGAFGKVYRARDPQLDREVAIKVPLRGALETTEDLQRFLREAQAAATVQHPNICPVYEVGQDGVQPYIVMALLAGKPLAAYLKKLPDLLPVRQAVLIARKLALALEAAHARGVVHRDLKPANIMFDHDRKDVVITDFGLACRPRSGDARLTHEGTLLGTPAYMAPEQARGDIGAVGPAADVYALGVVLYEMLANRLPFQGSTNEVLGKVLHVEPDPPSRHRPGLDARLDALCLKALAKNPAERYRSMKHFADSLGDYLRGQSVVVPAAVPVAAATTQVVEQLVSRLEGSTLLALVRQTSWRSHRLWAVTGCLLAASVLVLAVVLLLGRSGSTVVHAPVTVSLQGLTLIYDQSVKYYLDGTEVSPQKLREALTLAPGEHELVARRDDEVLERRPFAVRPGEQGQAVAVAPAAEPPPAPGRAPLLRRYVGHNRAVRGVWFLPGGRLILSSQVNGAGYSLPRGCLTFMWSTEQDASLKIDMNPPPPEQDRGIVAASFSRDGRHALFGVIDITDAILGHQGSPSLLLFDLDARKAIKDHHLAKGEALQLSGADITPDGKLALGATTDGIIRVLDTKTWKEVRRAEGVLASFSPDGQQILSVKGADLLLWEVLRDGPEMKRIKGKTAIVQAHWSPDGRRALTCLSDSTAAVSDLEAGQIVQTFKGHAANVTCGAYAPDGKRVLTGSADRTVRLWDVASGRELAKFEDHEGDVTSLACSPGGRRAVSGCADGRVRLWALPE